MKQIIYCLPILLLTFSCSLEYQLIGNWEESSYKKEHLTIEENGKMSFDNIGGPIEFKYEIIEKNDNITTFNVIVFRDGKELKSAKHSAVFNSNDTVTINNLDFKEVKPNTYHRLKK